MPSGATKSETRRATILQIAAELFAEEGYAATSMSMIAARLGGSKGTLYNYFKSKEAIFEAHIAAQCEGVASALFSVSQDQTDIGALLQVVGAHYVEHILDDTRVASFRILIAQSQRTPDLGRVFYEAGPMRGAQQLAQHIETAIARGALKPGNSEKLARQFLDICRDGMWMERLLNLRPAPSPAEAAESARSAVELFMALHGPSEPPA
jgi:AcrR family transcriptional regulator